MVRFRVVKASHILLVVAILALAGACIFIACQSSEKAANGAAQQQSTAGAEVNLTSIPASAVSGGLQIAVIPDASQPEIAQERMSILIYHTHTHEAYAQVEDDPYVAIETWRTVDQSHSVVQVGAVLAGELRRLGYDVTHDTTDHELDDINQAYVRSLETLTGYAQEFDLCIDLHRDAYSDGLRQCVTGDDGTQYAQLMLLVGRGDAYTGDEKPDYDANLYFAQQLTRSINDQIPDLCRNVTIKKGRYNQHLGSPMILLEAGHNLNTLDQVLASMPFVAKSIQNCLSS